jgi:hypothetical protein
MITSIGQRFLRGKSIDYNDGYPFCGTTFSFRKSLALILMWKFSHPAALIFLVMAITVPSVAQVNTIHSISYSQDSETDSMIFRRFC